MTFYILTKQMFRLMVVGPRQTQDSVNHHSFIHQKTIEPINGQLAQASIQVHEPIIALGIDWVH